MNDTLSRLLALSEADGSLRTLDGVLGDLDREETRLRGRLATEDEGFARRQEENRAHRLLALSKSGEVDDTDAKIRVYQHKLDHDIIPYREMEHLREQVTFLRGRLDVLADEALRRITEADEDDEKLVTDTEEHTARRARLEGELAALARRRTETLAEREDLRGKRAELLQEVPTHLRGAYERLLGAGGSPVVPVTGGMCGGCHLRLVDNTVEKVRADREAVTCEHCSRFLYLRAS